MDRNPRPPSDDDDSGTRYSPSQRIRRRLEENGDDASAMQPESVASLTQYWRQREQEAFAVRGNERASGPGYFFLEQARRCDPNFTGTGSRNVTRASGPGLFFLEQARRYGVIAETSPPTARTVPYTTVPGEVRRAVSTEDRSQIPVQASEDSSFHSPVRPTGSLSAETAPRTARTVPYTIVPGEIRRAVSNEDHSQITTQVLEDSSFRSTWDQRDRMRNRLRLTWLPMMRRSKPE